MNKLIIQMFLLVSLIIPSVSCSPGLDTEKEFYEWMNDPDNGFVNVKKINGMILKAKLLPSEYLTYKEFKNIASKTDYTKDSIQKWYDNSLSFILNFELDESVKLEDKDIMRYGVGNYEEYKERVLAMNFEFSENISLLINGKEEEPLLVNLENVHGLKNDRNVNLVFAKPEGISPQKVELVFKDEFFNTGITHFSFDLRKLTEIPQLTFVK